MDTPGMVVIECESVVLDAMTGLSFGIMCMAMANYLFVGSWHLTFLLVVGVLISNYRLRGVLSRYRCLLQQDYTSSMDYMTSNVVSSTSSIALLFILFSVATAYTAVHTVMWPALLITYIVTALLYWKVNNALSYYTLSVNHHRSQFIRNTVTGRYERV